MPLGKQNSVTLGGTLHYNKILIPLAGRNFFDLIQFMRNHTVYQWGTCIILQLSTIDLSLPGHMVVCLQ